MSTSRDLTRFLLALSALLAFWTVAFGQQTDSVVQVSDQKAGSFLVYPYYASGAAGSGSGDTRLTISNIGPTAPFGFLGFGGNGPVGAIATAQTMNIHLFFLDATCAQADLFLCLTPNASVSFKASEFDPFTTRGALYAVAVDSQGFPIAYNGLIGNAFVNYTDAQGRQYVGNYGAEAFFALGRQFAGTFYTTFADPFNPAIPRLLFIDNSPRVLTFGYDAAPIKLAAEIQSPLDARDQTIVTVGLRGTIGGTVDGAGQTGVGTVINGNEKPFGSFTGFTGGCNGLQIITASNPRVPLGMNGIIPTGQVGTIQWNVGAAVGLIMTPQRVGGVANPWSGIRTLHKTASAPFNSVTLTLPLVTPPEACGVVGFFFLDE